MVLIQDASFKKPKGNWQKKYVQLDFSVSIKELEKMAKDLRLDGEIGRELYKTEKEWLNQKWLCVAFMEKCGCRFCKPGWKAYEKAVKGVK